MKKLKLRRNKSDQADTAPKPKKAKVKHPKLPSAWKLFIRSVKDYASDWKPYSKILIFVAIPTNLLSLIALGSSQGATQEVVDAYVTIASVIMTVALLWAVSQRAKTGTVPTPRHAYYDGSIAIVRFLLVTGALIIFLIPALIGVVIEDAALGLASYSGTFGPEQYVAGLLALIVASPTIFLITRYGLAPILSVTDDLRPVAALRAAKALTIRRFWPVLGRFLSLLVYAFAVSVAAYVISYIKIANLGLVIFQFLATLIALPIVYIYLLHLTDELKASLKPKEETQ